MPELVVAKRVAPEPMVPGSVSPGTAGPDGAAPGVASLRPPVVCVLGEVRLEVASGVDMPPGHQRQATELIAYLAFHPGARGSDISAALWPTRDPNLATRRSAVSRARRWLGVDAQGHEHLPRYWSADSGVSVDGDTVGYRLRGVTTDWDAFCELVGDDPTATPLVRLRAALDLVRGPVFAGVPARKYVWAESLLQELTAAIVNVAHDVAVRALQERDLELARYAARVGRLVDPADERTWRDAIRTEWSAGRPEAMNRLAEQLREYLAALALDPDVETAELLDEINEALARSAAPAPLDE